MKSKEELIKFTEEIASIYEEGKIKAPIHLSGGNEDSLIKIYSENKIDSNTWIFSTWRSHYHWLLSGRSEEELKKQILDGHSMHIYGHKFFTSAIVAGIAPIALGVALSLKMSGSKEKVWCFLGCAAAACGISIESINYAEGHDLPIVFVIENNDKCVRASTSEVWGNKFREGKLIIYNYSRKYNHAGIGLNGEKKYVMF